MEVELQFSLSVIIEKLVINNKASERKRTIMEKFKMLVVDPIGTGKRIKQYRIERGLKVIDLLKYFDFSTERTIHYWESGTFVPTIDHLGVLMSIFNITLNELVVFNSVEIEIE